MFSGNSERIKRSKTPRLGGMPGVKLVLYPT